MDIDFSPEVGRIVRTKGDIHQMVDSASLTEQQIKTFVDEGIDRP